jgi:hypothetical protein
LSLDADESNDYQNQRRKQSDEKRRLNEWGIFGIGEGGRQCGGVARRVSPHDVKVRHDTARIGWRGCGLIVVFIAPRRTCSGPESGMKLIRHSFSPKS